MLDQELEFYETVEDGLKAEHPDGGFVIIKDQKIFGFWRNKLDAMEAAYREYGTDVVFLIKDLKEGIHGMANFSRSLIFT